MNKSAYFTTSLVVKSLAALSKASIIILGKENLVSAGPSIFVVNHFTRLETLLLPMWLNKLTGKPVFSLGAEVLFTGGLRSFFDRVGVVSTADPDRDGKIIGSLVTGEADWIIFPEGKMVRNKKIIDDGRFMIIGPDGAREPHTGAAVLAMRAELFRNYLREVMSREPEKMVSQLTSFGLDEAEEICRRRISLVPVNITYNPLRTARNAGSVIFKRLSEGVPEKVMEDLMKESSVLFSGVDITVHFGTPIKVQEYVDEEWLLNLNEGEANRNFRLPASCMVSVKANARELMQYYMKAIYSMTTVNHEHLMALQLRLSSHDVRDENEVRRRLLYMAMSLGKKRWGLNLHHSLRLSQYHLVSDDRYGKYSNFLQLAMELGVIERKGSVLFRDRNKLSTPLSRMRGRIDNPIEVIANEAEPLTALQVLVRKVTALPGIVVDMLLVRMIVREQLEQYIQARRKFVARRESEDGDLSAISVRARGRPVLRLGWRRRRGVLLVHSYLAGPIEMAEAGMYLKKAGYSSYAVRLPGHGTTETDLKGRKYDEWLETVEAGYALMSALCSSIVICGVGVGASLALEFASRVKHVSGVYAVCPPFILEDYSNQFMPEQDVWQQILAKFNPKSSGPQDFLEFNHGNPHINYHYNPVAGIAEVGRLLTDIRSCYQKIQQPVVILQTDENPVVNPEGSRQVYSWIGSKAKEYYQFAHNEHVLLTGKKRNHVLRKLVYFLREL